MSTSCRLHHPQEPRAILSRAAGAWLLATGFASSEHLQAQLTHGPSVLPSRRLSAAMGHGGDCGGCRLPQSTSKLEVDRCVS